MAANPPGTGRRLVRWTGNLLLVVVMLVCAAWLLPSLLGYERYVITGGSMSGTFEKGSIAFEREVPVTDLRVGDVITYQPPPGAGTTDLVTHRIVAIRPGRDGRPVFRTQGDANAAPDPWRFSLAGPTQPVVEHTVPYAGHAFIALADREVRMGVIGGPAVLVALVALGQLIAAVRPGSAPHQTGAGTADSAPAASVPAQREPTGVSVPATLPGG